MTLKSHFALNTVFRVELFSVDALALSHDCFKIDEAAHNYTVSAKTQHGLRFLAMPIFVGFAGEVVSNESVVVENASFLFRSLYISKFTRLRAVSRRLHRSRSKMFSLATLAGLHFILQLEIRVSNVTSPTPFIGSRALSFSDPYFHFTCLSVGSRALSFSDPYIHFACLSVRHSVILSVRNFGAKYLGNEAR